MFCGNVRQTAQQRAEPLLASLGESVGSSGSSTVEFNFENQA